MTQMDGRSSGTPGCIFACGDGADRSRSDTTAASTWQAHSTRAKDRLRRVDELRAKHGFTSGSTQIWSRTNLASLATDPRYAPNQDHKNLVDGQIIIGLFASGKVVEVSPNYSADDLPTGITEEVLQAYPNNARVLNELKVRLALFGFDWSASVRLCGRSHKRLRTVVTYINYPTVGGVHPTLTDLLVLPLELFDGYAERTSLIGVPIGEPADTNGSTDYADHISRQDQTGIGYKGFEGVSWHSMRLPFVLPLALRDQIQDLAEATFAFFDAVIAVLHSDDSWELRQLLNHKRPRHIPGFMPNEPLLWMRPDVVLQADPKSPSGYTPVVTEFESCPAGHGMVHAMNMGFGLDDDMLDKFIEFLGGRPYVVVATHEWSEYLWDQGAFIAALRERGVDARIVFDRPLSEIHEDVQARWQIPKGTPPHMKEKWSTDFLGRISARGWSDFIFGVQDMSEFSVADGTVLFRFGYFDNFDIEGVINWLQSLVSNYRCTLMNPNQFYLESKALMAALGNDEVRNWLSLNRPGALAVLDRCIAHTRVLDEDLCDIEALTGNDTSQPLCQPYALTKYAAWDGNNESWGSRSLVVGAQLTGPQWKAAVAENAEKPHPVVAQHVIASSTHQVVYVDGGGNLQVLKGARTRLTPFFGRMPGGKAEVFGNMLTLRAASLRIHGATDSVEVPVIFSDDDSNE